MSCWRAKQGRDIRQLGRGCEAELGQRVRDDSKAPRWSQSLLEQLWVEDVA